MRLALCSALALVVVACGGSGGGETVCRIACIQVPAVTLNVTDARGTGLTATVTLTNVVVPAGVGTYSTSCTTFSGAATCTVAAGAAGHYELDVTAPGFVTQHVVVEVGAPISPPTGCCPVAYVPAKRDVALVAQ